MNIYLLNMLLTILWGSILLNKNNEYKKMFVCIVSLQLIILSGLRDISIGADTWNYENHFYELTQFDIYSWKNLFARFFQFGSYTARDTGYEIVTKLFATLIPNFRIYLFAIAIFFCWGLGRFLLRHSGNLCLSYVVFESFLLQFFLLTGIRQTIAVCLTVFWGYDLILNKKLVKYVLLCLIAMTFHTTAIIMLPFYFVCNSKKNFTGKYLIAIFASALFIIFGSRIFKYIPLGMFSVYANAQGITSHTFIFLMLSIVIVVAFLDKTQFLKLIDRNDINIVNGTVISEVLISTSAVLDVLFRLGYYYIFFMLCMIPKILQSFENKSSRIIKIMLYVILVLYVYRMHMEYKFCF